MSDLNRKYRFVDLTEDVSIDDLLEQAMEELNIMEQVERDKEFWKLISDETKKYLVETGQCEVLGYEP